MYQLPELNRFSNLLHAYSEKSEGNMSFKWGKREEVIEHRKKFLNKLSVASTTCIGVALNHGIEVQRVGLRDRNQGMEDPEGAIPGDALCTDASDTFLFLLTGDCLPIIFYDPAHSAVGLAHASRLNTPKFLMREVIAHMEKWFSSSPEDIVVAIGPGVRKGTYRFPKYMRQELISVWKGFLEEDTPETFTLDVEGWNIAQLKSLGIQKKNIFLSPKDTISDITFFSHHRSLLTKEPEGRIATVAGLKNNR